MCISKRNDAWRHGLKAVSFLDGQHMKVNPTNSHCHPANLRLKQLYTRHRGALHAFVRLARLR
jgi:hypothetical protein